MLKKKHLFSFATVVSSVGMFFTAQWFCKKQTAGFSMYRISSSLPYNELYVTKEPPEKEALDMALSVPYYFLGKGAQSFVFASENDQWVIKFFKQSSLRPSPLVHLLPQKIRQRKVEEKQQDLHKDFLSYKLAFDLLAKETGLVFVHLNKSCNLKRKVTIYDKLRIAHTIDLDNMEFLIQKRAELFYPALEALIRQGDKAAAQLRLQELVELIKKRSELGLYDKDPDINTNFGICGQKTIQIDVGRYRIDPSRKDPRVYVPDMLRATDNLRQWLLNIDPELSIFLQRYIEQQLLDGGIEKISSL